MEDPMVAAPPTKRAPRKVAARTPRNVATTATTATPKAAPKPTRVVAKPPAAKAAVKPDRKSTRLNSSHPSISYAVFCLKKKKKPNTDKTKKTKQRQKKQRASHHNDHIAQYIVYEADTHRTKITTCQQRAYRS